MMLGIALPILSLLAAESAVVNEQRYDASMKCATTLLFADTMLKAGGHGPSQMGAMMQVYLKSARDEGLALGKSADSIQSEFVTSATAMQTQLKAMDENGRKQRLRETIDLAKSCATRLAGDGDKK